MVKIAKSQVSYRIKFRQHEECGEEDRNFSTIVYFLKVWVFERSSFGQWVF